MTLAQGAVVADAAFASVANLVRHHAHQRPAHAALQQGSQVPSYAALDALMDRVAAALQRDGVQPGQAIVLAGTSTPLLAAVLLGALRAGVVVAPLSTSVRAASFASMLHDADAQWLFIDNSAAALVPPALHGRCVTQEPGGPRHALNDWLAPEGATPLTVQLEPGHRFSAVAVARRWNDIRRLR